MNKKFLSAILFGALMVTSTGTFVSCKDYDEDIDGLQTQVDANKSTLSTLSSQASTLQSALTAAQSTADAAKAAAAEAKKAGDDALAKAKEAEAAAAQAKADAIKDAADKVEALKAWVAEGYATKAELATAIAVVNGQIEGIEAGLSDLTDFVKGLEEQLNTLNLTALSNIAALQEDLEIQKAAIKALQESTTDEELAADLDDVIEAIKALESNYGQAIGNLANRLDDLDETLAAKFESQDTFINQLTQIANTLTEDVDKNKSSIDELWAALNGEGADSMSTKVGQLAGLVGEIQGNLLTLHTLMGNMITSVDLWAPQSTDTRTLALYNVVEKAAVFGDKTAIKANENITFTEGKLVSYEDELVIRVSPTNAQITKEQISLINTLGEDLGEYLEVTSVKAYNELYTGGQSRSAENKSGLWTVSFKLKEGVDPVKFADEVAQVKKNNTWYYVRYAVAVKNAETNANVISGYNVQVNTPDAGAYGRLDFYANDRHINYINNRYAYNSACADIEELWWAASTTEIKTPAVTPVLEGEGKNVYSKDDAYAANNHYDYRSWYSYLPVVKGEAITININSYQDAGNWIVNNNGKIAGFYVTLDKAYAVESAPSELNAWNTYEYENVGTDKQAATMIKGNSGTITIKDMNNVSGDIIGFRVYAVNLDGTLMDPDGRAFYVAVGEAAAETQVVKATIAPKAQDDQTVIVALTDAQKTAIRALYEKHSYTNWNMDTNNPEVNGTQGSYYVTFVKDAEGAAISSKDDINYVKFTLNSTVDNYLDNGTYKAKQTFYNTTDHVLGEVEYELTKTLPSAFPTAFSAKDKQIIDGIYTCYLQPTTSTWVASSATTGYMDLGSAFNGLLDMTNALADANYSFEFATSAYDDTDDALVEKVVTATDKPDYRLEIGDANYTAAEFIEAGVAHATKVYYVYKGISSYKDSEGNWKTAQDHKVAWSTQFSTVYACWHNAQTWAAVSAAKNVITYADNTGKTVDLANIKGTNTYNNTEFGKTLKVLVETDGYLTIKSAKLTSNATDVEEYFDVDDATLEFKPLKDDVQSNPKADVPSTLTIVCEDCFGCEVTIAIPYTVKKQ